MPEVIVRRDPNYLKTEELEKFFTQLAIIIADVLSVPGTDEELNPITDIVIRDVPHGDHDYGTMDLEITIMATTSKARRKRLPRYAKEIITGIQALKDLDEGFVKNSFQEGKNNVWVVLVRGSFEIF